MNVPSIFQTKTYITIDANQNLKEEKFNFIFRALRALGLYSNSHLKTVANRSIEILSKNNDTLKGKADNYVQIALKAAYLAQEYKIAVTNNPNATFAYNKTTGIYGVIKFDFSPEYSNFKKDNDKISYLKNQTPVKSKPNSLPMGIKNKILFKHLVQE